MSLKLPPERPVPGWMTALIVILCLPGLFLPFLPGMEQASAQLGQLFNFFPLYLLAAAVCALIAYKQRPELTWILLAIMVLSYIAVISLCFIDVHA